MKKARLDLVLRRLLDDRKISARQLSRDTGIPQSTITSFMSNRGLHKPDHLYILAQYFGVSMETLLFGKDDRPPSLNEVLTEGVFEGWLKVKIERAIPNKRKTRVDDDES